MVLLRVVPIIRVVTALAVSAGVALPSPAGGVWPVLTSAPFGAAGGQPVIHTITLAGTGALSAARVTFTTTVRLDAVTAAASQGSCPVVTAVQVVCDLGAVTLSPGAAAPVVTINGTVHSGTAPGSLVQNVVALSSPGRAVDPATGVVSNAYLVAAGGVVPLAASTAPPVPHPAPDRGRANPLPTVSSLGALVALVLLGVAIAGLTLRRRRHGP